jgi:dynein heavy chain
LKAAKSSYLGPFDTLSNIIQNGSIEAQNNLKFLKTLEPACEDMSRAAPADIPTILPRLLNHVRMIWNLSRFYSSDERVTGLLRKISNELIRCCCKNISLDAIFNGDIEACITVLEQSIECGVSWKRIYRQVIQGHLFTISASRSY